MSRETVSLCVDLVNTWYEYKEKIGFEETCYCFLKIASYFSESHFQDKKKSQEEIKKILEEIKDEPGPMIDEPSSL